MASENLRDQIISQTYSFVLHVVGGVAAAIKNVYGGDGTLTALQLSTTVVKANGDFQIGKGLVRAVNRETLSTNKTLTEEMPCRQYLDPNGADRVVKLPSNPAQGRTYFVKNVGSANVLDVQYASGTSIVSLNAGDLLEVEYVGTVWEY